MNSVPTTLAVDAALSDHQALAPATERVGRAIGRAPLGRLTLKLAAGFALPALVLVAVAVVIWSMGGTLQAWPEGTARTALERWLHIAVALVAAGVVACAGAFLVLRHLLVRPIRRIDALLARMSSADGELSHQLEAMSKDELGDLAMHFNDFVNKLRTLVNDVRKQCLTVAFGSAAMNGRIFDSAAVCRSQQAETERIFELSTAATKAMSEVAENASQIAVASEERTVVAEKAYAELLAVTARVGGVRDSIAAFTGTVGELDANSRSIGEIVKLINDISDQTNLLALNAAIEAARAGEVGRGFAVVADEVRKLAEKVRKATDVISESISNMTALVTSTQRESQAISKDIEHTREVVERSSHHFESMVASFTQMRAQVHAIGAAISGLETTNKAIHESASGIRQLTGRVAEDMQQSTTSAQDLTSATERIAEIVAQFRTGSGRFEAVIETTRRYRDQVAAELETLALGGADVFDANYRPVANTAPQKYRTTYDAQCERRLQPLYDQLVADIAGGVFAVAVDVNAYAPTHNSKYSQPPTGDAQRDRVHSRDKRIFDDPTGLRAAKNSRPMLLQTYRRDTGELLGDLSMPIHVRGRHWGALRLGCKLDALAG